MLQRNGPPDPAHQRHSRPSKKNTTQKSTVNMLCMQCTPLPATTSTTDPCPKSQCTRQTTCFHWLASHYDPQKATYCQTTPPKTIGACQHSHSLCHISWHHMARGPQHFHKEEESVHWSLRHGKLVRHSGELFSHKDAIMMQEQCDDDAGLLFYLTGSRPCLIALSGAKPGSYDTSL